MCDDVPEWKNTLIYNDKDKTTMEKTFVIAI